MEQYWGLMWKNYTASLSRNSNDEDITGETNDASDTFANSDLHYKIPFWIGTIAISLLFLSAIIASVRYCFHALCSSRTGTEKVSLVPPKSPFIPSSAAHTIQRQARSLPSHDHHHSSLSSPNESRDEHCSKTSIVPIIRQHTRPPCTSTHTLPRRHQKELDAEDSYFPPMETPRNMRGSHDFRKKVHGIYVLPVSPALSSSSSTTANTDEMNKNTTNTMPIRSLRHISSSINVQKDSTAHGIKNDSFADSPQPKDRTLPRSHGGTLRRVPPPAQPPPLPPTTPQLHSNHIRSFVDHRIDQTSIQQQSTNIDLDPDAIALRLSSQKIYGAFRDNQLKKAPPVPCRSQKPPILPIGFEGLHATSSSDMIGFRMMLESSAQEDSSEHNWPQPPESMTTSMAGGPPPVLPPSIPYDRLHHDHSIANALIRHNSTTTFFQHHRFDGHTMFSESET